MQRNATQCNAMQRNATQCNAMQRNATQCNARFHSAALGDQRIIGFTHLASRIIAFMLALPCMCAQVACSST
jgi:hypothetical protein